MDTKIKLWKYDYNSAVLSDVLNYCVENLKSDHALLVDPLHFSSGTKLKPHYDGVSNFTNKHFRKYIVTKFISRIRPFTIDQGGMVYVLNLNKEVVKLIVRLEPSLKNWRGNARTPLPEDLTLFRLGTNCPDFVSITHERMAWILAKEDVHLPGVAFDCNLSEDKVSVKYLNMIKNEKYFCRRMKKNKSTD